MSWKAADLEKKPHLQLLQIHYQTGQHPYLISNTLHPHLVQRGYIYTVYFRHITLLWLDLVIVGFLYSQQRYSDTWSRQFRAQGTAQHALCKLLIQALISHDQGESVHPLHTFQHCTMLHACCTYEPKSLCYFRLATVTSLPASPWVRRTNAMCLFGQQKTSGVKGQDVHRNTERNEIYFLRHRNLETCHEHILALLRQLLKILMELTVQSHHTPVRPSSDSHTADL